MFSLGCSVHSIHPSINLFIHLSINPFIHPSIMNPSFHHICDSHLERLDEGPEQSPYSLSSAQQLDQPHHSEEPEETDAHERRGLVGLDGSAIEGQLSSGRTLPLIERTFQSSSITSIHAVHLLITWLFNRSSGTINHRANRTINHGVNRTINHRANRTVNRSFVPPRKMDHPSHSSMTVHKSKAIGRSNN